MSKINVKQQLALCSTSSMNLQEPGYAHGQCLSITSAVLFHSSVLKNNLEILVLLTQFISIKNVTFIFSI